MDLIVLALCVLIVLMYCIYDLCLFYYSSCCNVTNCVVIHKRNRTCKNQFAILWLAAILDGYCASGGSPVTE